MTVVHASGATAIATDESNKAGYKLLTCTCCTGTSIDSEVIDGSNTVMLMLHAGPCKECDTK